MLCPRHTRGGEIHEGVKRPKEIGAGGSFHRASNGPCYGSPWIDAWNRSNDSRSSADLEAHEFQPPDEIESNELDNRVSRGKRFMWMYTSAAASFDIRIWLIRVVQFIGRERGREREKLRDFVEAVHRFVN